MLPLLTSVYCPECDDYDPGIPCPECGSPRTEAFPIEGHPEAWHCWDKGHVWWPRRDAVVG